MRITHVDVTPVSIPIDPSRAIRGSRGYHDRSTYLILEVQTDEGLVGLGEVSCTAVWSGEDHVMARQVVEAYLVPTLVGQDPLQIETRTREMRRAVAGSPFVIAGLEVALWDLLGKACGQPIYRLLGGPVRDRIETKFSISGLEPERAAAIASWAAESGFPSMKVKVGFGAEVDEARVRAVREAIGPDVKLGIDANGGWSPREAIATLGRLAAYDIAFAEQPVAPDDPAWMADVRANVGVPVLADESVFGLRDAAAVVRSRAADMLSIYVGKGGGIGTAVKIAHLAEGFGVACTIGSNLEMGIATAAQIHLGLALPAVRPEAIACDILSPFLYQGSVLDQPLPIVPGEARAPAGPSGLGVSLDRERLRRFAIADTATLTA